MQVPWLQEQDQQSYMISLLNYVDEHRGQISPSYFKRSALLHVFTANKLEGTLASGASEGATYKLLESIWDGNETESPLQMWFADGEKACPQTQMSHHIRALRFILELHKLDLPSLLRVHALLMESSMDSNKFVVQAGFLRTCSVHADQHVYPDPACLEHALVKILSLFESRCCEKLDLATAVELSMHLFYDVITLHPFVDGNGRICRLLLSYALIRTGATTFPISLTSGHKKARKHYIDTILKVRRDTPNWFPLRLLITVSLHRGWKNLIINQEFERNGPKSAIEELQIPKT
jgi:fido (protein-threonine AMPylation protein)